MIDLGSDLKYGIRWITDRIGWVEPVGIKYCPVCGSDVIWLVWVQEDFTLRLTKGDIVVPDLIFQRCSRCQEAFLNHRARQRIEKEVNRVRKGP